MSSVNETSGTELTPPIERIPAAERREQILAAASVVFGERGYSGATTDQVARAAGISQPYVVRMFGTKENLFLEVLARALDRLITGFRQIIAEPRERGDDEIELLSARLGAAYVDLIEDRGILLSLMQAFISGHNPVIGAKARAGFLEIYRMMRDEAGFPPEEIRGFLAEGMLFNTLLAIRLPDVYDDDEAAAELMRCAFRGKLDVVLSATAAAPAEHAGTQTPQQ
ncbi:TetR/AcrR family transcriptional regulator [Cryobacterium sp.]|jgi:TetR/AcrR family transcriptional regulator|uniref:TetR/AcrR family transcriptional regulator n=1 Tax=Cryobacterium sp. TaxID=1926290 RepID=UPI00262DFD87|nr:TetR/AcrR family transcriptional regulator [Cryobacterium sp.]MCU1444703.1 TetR family transcriptional regulator [Cryobacterium sp.]